MKPIRWYIRLEAVRTPKFGENPRDVLRWAAFTYRDRDENGRPIPLYRPTYFLRPTAAFNYAHHMVRGVA